MATLSQRPTTTAGLLFGFCKRMAAFSACLTGGCLLLAACAPALDWREVSFAPGQTTLWFPCKPVRQERELEIAPGQRHLAVLLACDAQGASFAALEIPLQAVATQDANASTAGPTDVLTSKVPMGSAESLLSGMMASAAQRWGTAREWDASERPSMTARAFTGDQWRIYRSSGSTDSGSNGAPSSSSAPLPAVGIAAPQVWALFFQTPASVVQITYSGASLSPSLAQTFFAQAHP